MTDQERIQALKDLDASDHNANQFIRIYTEMLTNNELQRAELTTDLSETLAQACEVVGVKIADKKSVDKVKLARTKKLEELLLVEDNEVKVKVKDL